MELLKKIWQSFLDFRKKLLKPIGGGTWNSAIVDLINDAEDIMKQGGPVSNSIVFSIGKINWSGERGKSTRGYVDIPLKRKYNYIFDKKLGVWVPKDIKKRNKELYSPSQIKSMAKLSEEILNIKKKAREGEDSIRKTRYIYKRNKNH